MVDRAMAEVKYHPREWRGMKGCPMAPGLDAHGRNQPGICPCGQPIPVRRLVWCSKECVEWIVGNHRFGYAAQIVRREARERKEGCALCGASAYEVDHIERAMGRHSEMDCVHHRSNLRLLCDPCHRARTADQLATPASLARKEAKSAASRAKLERAARRQADVDMQLPLQATAAWLLVGRWPK